MAVSLKHVSLKSTLLGARGVDVVHFRGIPYAEIPKRFAASRRIAQMSSELDCRNFGPRCPQVEVDSRYLLRIPKIIELPKEEEDELACTNLDVCVPDGHAGVAGKHKLPVLLWIHGGSQAVTFGSAKSGICDPTKLVQQSVKLDKPMIVVNVQYRLNVFALSDGKGPANLALRDQRLALDWVQDHIEGFGGDPAAVTVYGESAGGVYAHAHLVSKAPAKQFILSSGSLFLSPPQPPQNVVNIRKLVGQKLEAIKLGANLEDAPVKLLVEAVKAAGISSFFLQQEEILENWQASMGDATRLLLTDVQKEAIIWQEGMWFTTAQDLVGAFDKVGAAGDSLKHLYHVHEDRPSSSKTGALDFINDYKFLLPVEVLREQWSKAGKPVFRGVFDELNPWQPSTGAHHAIDVVLLFEGIDLSFSPAAQRTAAAMRKAWIDFVSGSDPWDASRGYYGFGPHGSCHLLDDAELRSRRRLSAMETLRKIDTKALDATLVTLTAGKISLLN
ncbi:hypothetical protein SEUCBS140593_003739 [Sporothrix eucalyptigena]|uniref:Carboxylic ester hydrolase n=1 Tax=Sporothrix eucalyptigena TaxID=1812306 RepID=A0ABP0BHA5_9PEZI